MIKSSVTSSMWDGYEFGNLYLSVYGSDWYKTLTKESDAKSSVSDVR